MSQLDASSSVNKSGTVADILKALFNSVFTLKNLSCMSSYAISVFDKVYKESPEKKLHLKRSENRQVIGFILGLYSFLPIDCCVRINGEPDGLFSGDIQSQIS